MCIFTIDNYSKCVYYILVTSRKERDIVYPNIDAERARKGLTVNELVKQLGVCRKTYYNWINKGKIPREKLEQLADIFSVSTDYLLGLTNPYGKVS